MANPLSFGGPANGMFGRLTRPLYSMPMMTEAEKDTARRNYELQQRRNPTIAQRAGRATERGMRYIGAPELVAKRQGQSIEGGIGFLPIIGDITGSEESGRMIGEGLREGSPMKTALGAGTGIFGLLPFMPSLTGILGRNADDIAKGFRAYHGSPHKFDKFDLSKIGTGEGAQAYGHGLYFAEAEPVAREYRDKLSAEAGFRFAGKDGLTRSQVLDMVNEKYGKSYLDNVTLPSGIADQVIDAKMYGGSDARLKVGTQRKALFDELMSNISHSDPGHMYEVNIAANPSDFLDWDAPLANQSASVQQVARDADLSHFGPGHRTRVMLERFRAGEEQPHYMAKGRDLMMALDDTSGNDFGNASTKALLDQGIPGIRYLDEQSRAAGNGTRNTVLFDDKLVSILKRYGWVPGTAVPAWMMSQAQSEKDKGI